MDFVFSIDNIFAITAFSHNIKVIFLGVSIGIIVMRFASNKFIKIIEMSPILNKITYYHSHNVLHNLWINLSVPSFKCVMPTSKKVKGY